MSIPVSLEWHSARRASKLPRVQTFTAMPESFAAGHSFTLTKSFPDHTGAGGWTITLFFAGASVGSVQGNDVGGGQWSWDVVKGETVTFPPGTYRWDLRGVKSASEEVVLASGLTTITRNLSTAAAGDAQSWEEKTLALVETAIADIVAGKIQSYTIAGRGAERLGLEDLKKLRGELAEAVRYQRTGVSGRQHLVNFLPPR